MLEIILGFVGILAFFSMIGGIVYAGVNKKEPSATVVKAIVSILVVALVVGGGLWWYLSSSSGRTSPSLATVRDWVWSYWLWVIAVGIVAYVATSFIPKVGGTIKYIVAVGAVSLFTVIPLVAWIASPSTAGPQAHTMRNTIPLASLPRTEWPKLVIPAGGRSETVSRPSGMRIRMSGANFEHYMVFADGSICPSAQPCTTGSIGSFAQNESGATNTIIYAYEPDR